MVIGINPNLVYYYDFLFLFWWYHVHYEPGVFGCMCWTLESCMIIIIHPGTICILIYIYGCLKTLSLHHCMDWFGILNPFWWRIVVYLRECGTLQFSTTLISSLCNIKFNEKRTWVNIWSDNNIKWSTPNCYIGLGVKYKLCRLSSFRATCSKPRWSLLITLMLYWRLKSCVHVLIFWTICSFKCWYTFWDQNAFMFGCLSNIAFYM
jgi:hypothetical protein